MRLHIEMKMMKFVESSVDPNCWPNTKDSLLACADY